MEDGYQKFVTSLAEVGSILKVGFYLKIMLDDFLSSTFLVEWPFVRLFFPGASSWWNLIEGEKPYFFLG